MFEVASIMLQVNDKLIAKRENVINLKAWNESPLTKKYLLGDDDQRGEAENGFKANNRISTIPRSPAGGCTFVLFLAIFSLP